MRRAWQSSRVPVSTCLCRSETFPAPGSPTRRTGEDWMTTREIIGAANDVLTQGIELLLDLDDRSFTKMESTTVPTSIGKQYRQMLNHFVSLVHGLRSGEIDYGRPGTS